MHAAVAAPYAHVSAPLRRLVDRFGLVQISDPTILAPVQGECSAGGEVTVRLVEADVAKRSVRLQVVEG